MHSPPAQPPSAFADAAGGPPDTAPALQPAALESLDRVRQAWREGIGPDADQETDKDTGKDRGLWVFGYASLIWRPEFEPAERRPARVQGWHRSLRMASRINRGTPEQPGLVFALLPGGACSGVALRLDPSRVDAELEALWLREMPIAVYVPRWLRCVTPQGPVQALAFTLPRSSPAHTGVLDDARLLHILRHAKGRYGTTLDYLLETARSLREHGIRDREVERMVSLATRHGLTHSHQDSSG